MKRKKKQLKVPIHLRTNILGPAKLEHEKPQPSATGYTWALQAENIHALNLNYDQLPKQTK